MDDLYHRRSYRTPAIDGMDGLSSPLVAKPRTIDRIRRMPGALRVDGRAQTRSAPKSESATKKRTLAIRELIVL